LVEEPLSESAPLAPGIAAERCWRDPRSGWSCSWYHGVWQTLRLLGLVTSPREHAEATAQGLRALARRGDARRVLISGSADYAMLAQVIDAWRAEGRALEVTVVDLCETPLALCRWYAEREGVAVRTVASDALDYRDDAAFDVVCCHSFMGYFDAKGRDTLARRWAALLRPGGRVFTVHRLRPSYRGDTLGFDAAQARAFRERVLDRAREQGLPGGLGLGWLAEATDHYTEDFRIHPVRSAAELAGHFEQAGLRIVELGACGIEAAAASVSGPAVAEAADFVRVVAERSAAGSSS